MTPVVCEIIRLAVKGTRAEIEKAVTSNCGSVLGQDDTLSSGAHLSGNLAVPIFAQFANQLAFDCEKKLPHDGLVSLCWRWSASAPAQGR